MLFSAHDLTLEPQEKRRHRGQAPVITVTLFVAAFYVAFTLVALALHGWDPFVSGPSLERIPLMGIVPYLTPDAGRLSAFLFAGLPALFSLLVASGLLWRQRGHSPIAWWVFLNSLFVVLMPLEVYNHIMHAGRNASGLVLSLVFLLPLIRERQRIFLLAYLVVPTVVWLIPVLRGAPWDSTW